MFANSIRRQNFVSIKVLTWASERQTDFYMFEQSTTSICQVHTKMRLKIARNKTQGLVQCSVRNVIIKYSLNPVLCFKSKQMVVQVHDCWDFLHLPLIIESKCQSDIPERRIMLVFDTIECRSCHGSRKTHVPVTTLAFLRHTWPPDNSDHQLYSFLVIPSLALFSLIVQTGAKMSCLQIHEGQSH